MSPEREFDRVIAAIHGLDNPPRDGTNIEESTEESTMDVRHAEFQAMASVFLGDGFDPTKLGQVEDLQIALHKQKAELYHRYEAEELGPEEYVESFNTALDDTFAKCEAILGAENFLKLFGAPRSELAGFIDREAFLQAHHTRQNTLQSVPRPSQAEESTMPVGYRKRGGHDTWHFCSNCSTWPTSHYELRSHTPSTGVLCNECESKRAHGNCS